MAAVRVDVERLHKSVDERRLARGLSWRQVAAETDLSTSTLSRLARGYRPDVDGFASLVSWLGEEADAFFIRSRSAEESGPAQRFLAGLDGIADLPGDEGETWDIDAVVYGQ